MVRWKKIEGTIEERDEIFSTLKSWVGDRDADKKYLHKGQATVVSIVRIADDNDMVVKIDFRKGKKFIEVWCPVKVKEEDEVLIPKSSAENVSLSKAVDSPFD